MAEDPSRRDFIKGSVAGVGTAATLKYPDRFIPGKQEQQETLSEHELTVIADIFANETKAETRRELLENMTESVDALREVDLSFFNEEDKDDVFRAIEAYKSFGSVEPLKEAILDQLLLIGEGHGNFVEEVYQSHLEGIEPGREEETIHVGIQNATTGYSIKADALGITAKITVDPEILRTRMETQGVPLKGRLLAAFQFGQITARYNLFEVDKPIITSTVIDGQEYFIWGLAAEPGQQLGSQMIEGKVVPTARGKPIDPDHYAIYQGDSFDTRAIDQFGIDIQNHLYQQRMSEVLARTLSEEERAAYVHKTSVNKRTTYEEPYNSRENFIKLNEFARSVPEMVIVHAAGNNTDLRPHNDIERAPITIIVSGIGGLSNKREEKFGTSPGRLVGGIGADIYVSASDFREITNYLTASEATGIIGAYIDKLQSLGVTTTQIKSVLQENCCDFFTSDDENLELKVSQGEFAGGFVFNQEKAHVFVEQLENDTKDNNT